MWAIDANPATTVLQQQKSKEKHHVKIHMKRCIHPGPTKTGNGGIVIHWKPHVTVAGKLCCCGQASRCWSSSSSSCWWRECVFLWSLLMHTRARGGRELSCLSSHTHTHRDSSRSSSAYWSTDFRRFYQDGLERRENTVILSAKPLFILRVVPFLTGGLGRKQKR